MEKRPKIVIVMPAYNAEKTLEKTLADIPEGSADGIILVDDASRDRTAELARSLDLKVHVHPKNRGYGANQKTCYREALRRGADIVVMIHPDYQYDARLTPYLTGLIRTGACDVMLGNRIRTRWEALQGGMPLYKYVMNRLLTVLENLWTGQNLGEWHSGFQGPRRPASGGWVTLEPGSGHMLACRREVGGGHSAAPSGGRRRIALENRRGGRCFRSSRGVSAGVNRAIGETPGQRPGERSPANFRSALEM